MLQFCIEVPRNNERVTTCHALDGSRAFVQQLLSAMLILLWIICVNPDMLINV